MAETKKEVAHLDWRTFMEAKPDIDPEVVAALDKYFPHFVAVEVKDMPDGKKEFGVQKCIGCDKDLTGFFGTWRWGIAHGVGQCGSCGWPSHGHHFIKDEKGEEVVTLRNFILQVHPDFVERRKRA